MLAAVGVSVGLLLDLTEPDVLTALGVAPELLTADWRAESDPTRAAPTQVFGGLVSDVGLEGIRFRSARHPGGINLALFPDQLRDGSHAVMLNADWACNSACKKYRGYLRSAV